MSFCSSQNGPYIRIRLVTPQEEHNIHTGSTTPTDAFAPASMGGRTRGGRAQASLPLSAPMPMHPRRDLGPKRLRAARPQTPHYSNPHVCVLLLLLLLQLYDAATTAAAVVLLLLRLT